MKINLIANGALSKSLSEDLCKEYINDGDVEINKEAGKSGLSEILLITIMGTASAFLGNMLSFFVQKLLNNSKIEKVQKVEIEIYLDSDEYHFILPEEKEELIQFVEVDEK